MAAALSIDARSTADLDDEIDGQFAHGPERKERAPTRCTVRELFDAHFDALWGRARRLGLSDAEADDAAQEAFLVASKKILEIESGREAPFLFRTLTFVVRNLQRSAARRYERPVGFDEASLDSDSSAVPADAQLVRKEERELAETVIAELELDLRVVFVMNELEGFSMRQISEWLDLPPGTVASRLRRAREEFRAIVKRRVR